MLRDQRKAGIPVCERSRHHRRHRKYLWLKRSNNSAAKPTTDSTKPKQLPTHVWHAKRAHMRNQWGYTIAGTMADKGTKACLAAAAKHACIYDRSYDATLTLCGSRDSILNLLRRVCDPSSGSLFASADAVSGAKQVRKQV